MDSGGVLGSFGARQNPPKLNNQTLQNSATLYFQRSWNYGGFWCNFAVESNRGRVFNGSGIMEGFGAIMVQNTKTQGSRKINNL